MSGMTLREARKLPAVISPATAARALNRSRAWAYQAIASGDFPCTVIKVRGRYAVLTADLLRFLEHGTGGPEAA